MKVLLVGVGTVGEAIARPSAGLPWLEQMVLADHDLDDIHHATIDIEPGRAVA
jgi:predicted dinucleotide-utilizing enzyme